jgi:glucose-1-phosphate thymidylyltransferase
MKALILSGGKGTRLKPITHTGAKQLVPVANKPILFFVIENILNAGITDIGIVISPETGPAVQKAVIEHQFAHVHFTWITQPTPGGIAHAVKISRKFLGEDNFVVYLGDNLLQAGITDSIEVLAGHLGVSQDASIFLKKVSNPESFGVATLDEQGKLLRLIEKPVVPESDLALVGVYIFTPIVHSIIDILQPSARGELEITDALQIMLEEGYSIDARVLDGWWLDTGKKEDLLAANEVVLDSWAKRDVKGTLVGPTKVHGRVTVGKSLVSASTIRGPCIIGNECVIENSTINPFTCIGDASHIVDSKIQSSVLMGNNYLRNVKYLEDSLLAKGARIIASDCRGTVVTSLGEDSEIFIA